MSNAAPSLNLESSASLARTRTSAASAARLRARASASAASAARMRARLCKIVAACSRRAAFSVTASSRLIASDCAISNLSPGVSACFCCDAAAVVSCAACCAICALRCCSVKLSVMRAALGLIKPFIDVRLIFR